MTTRLRLLQGATALLYCGPLLAGMVGHGWAMVLPFTAIFVLWSVILRPHLWPRGRAGLIPLASLVATQVLLVALSFALGRGFGGVTGLRLELPFWFPAALSFLAVPLSRLAWPRPLAGFDPLAQRPAAGEGPGPLIAALGRLDEAEKEDVLEAHLLASEADPVAVRLALEGARGRVFDRARLIQATDPVTAAHFRGAAYPASLFPLPPEDLPLFAARALRLIAADPASVAELPPSQTLRQAATRAPAATADLLRLAEAREQA